MYALHTIIIRKSGISHEDAVAMAQNLMKTKKRPLMRETQASYRFRHLPKTKFVPSTFRTKKLNKTASLVYGQLKPEYAHLSGSGLFDYLKKGVQKVKEFFKPQTDMYNTKSATTLKQLGGERIQAMYMMRTPVKSMVHTLLNVISLGHWESVKRKYNYDKLFHLALIVEVGNKKVIVEKNEAINISTAFKNDADSEIFHINLQNKDITLNDLLEKTREQVGNAQFFEYDAFGGKNCQNFIDDILKANGLWTQDAHTWLFQPVDELVKDLPGYVPVVSKMATNIASTVNKWTGGEQQRMRKRIDSKLDRIISELYRTKV
jgi:hypothetical protein